MAAILLTFFGSLPLFALAIAPLGDWPSHLARVWITNQIIKGDPFWSARYIFAGLLIPNAILDMVVLGLMRLGCTVEVAGTGFLLLCYLTFVAGFVRLARRIPPHAAAALASMLFFTGDLGYGLVNFVAGVAVLLLALSFWTDGGRSIRQRYLISVCATPVIMLCHIIAAFVFVGLCGCYELFRPARLVSRRVAALGAACAAGAIAVAGLKLSRTGDDSHALHYDGAPLLAGVVRGKLRHAVEGLSSGNVLADLLMAGVVVGIAALLWRRRSELRRQVVAPILAVAALALILPYTVGHGSFLDTRLFVLPVILAIATCPWTATRRVQRAIGAAMLLRTVVLFVAWSGYAPLYRAMHEAFAALPRGSVLLSAYNAEPPFYAYHAPLMVNDASRAVQAGIFVPSVYSDPTQQPLVMRDEWLQRVPWSYTAPFRTPEQLDALRARAAGGCAANPDTFLFIGYGATHIPAFAIEPACRPR